MTTATPRVGDVLTTLAELADPGLPPQVGFQLTVRGSGALPPMFVLAYRAPNGLWWSTYKNPTTAEELWELSDGEGAGWCPCPSTSPPCRRRARCPSGSPAGTG